MLGSGGARGVAHIGVIKWLEEHGYDIRSIAGCSSGAMVGGIYAAGEFAAFEAWVRSVRRLDIINLLDIAWSRSGFVKGDKIIRTLTEIVGNHTIEDLPIKFTAVAVDIKNEKEVWLNKGDLFSAIRASMSIPLFFTPFPYNDGLLIDGGVLNPVPIAPTFGDDTDITIAVNLDAEDDTVVPEQAEPEPAKESGSRIQDAIAALSKRLTWPPSRSADEQPVGDIFGVALQAFETMQGTIARQKLAAYPPDHLIEIPRTASKMLEFHRSAELIDLGYRKAEQYLGGMKGR
ncbi:patatin-like phospholipase family protein [Kordiimonas marina]|uniref:patatin-like phospholipase family protein n=1 Tax=Kordiimonas marina TaxID=2872312 RepID=UPI001FF61637|nr:patatin-like phospholipase family protein [Kordiimonas marina]